MRLLLRVAVLLLALCGLFSVVGGQTIFAPVQTPVLINGPFGVELGQQLTSRSLTGLGFDGAISYLSHPLHLVVALIGLLAAYRLLFAGSERGASKKELKKQRDLIKRLHRKLDALEAPARGHDVHVDDRVKRRLAMERELATIEAMDDTLQRLEGRITNLESAMMR